MITKQGKIAAQMALVMHNDRRNGVLVKDTTGADVYYFGRANSNAWPSNGYSGTGTINIANPSTNSAAVGVYVGSGTTSPTENDYTLETPITSGLSGTMRVQYSDTLDNDGNPQLVQVLTLRNTSSSDITVSEVGWIAKGLCDASNNTASGSGKNLLFDRTVLNSPVTIPAGESAAITYTIKAVLPSS